MPDCDELLEEDEEGAGQGKDNDKDKAALLLWSLRAWHKKRDYDEGGSRRKLRRLQSKVRNASVSCDLSESDEPWYGSVLLTQVKECSQETTSFREYMSKSPMILVNTIFMTFVLGTLMVLPLGMISVGLKYLEDCPIQPKIPIYLLVGGCFGMLKLLTLIFYQVRSRHYEKLDDEDGSRGLSTLITSSRFMDVLLTAFLVAWFACGNYWVLSIWQPSYHLSLDDPNSWCNKTAYLFAFVQLMLCYGLVGVVVVTLLLLALCQVVWKRRAP